VRVEEARPFMLNSGSTRVTLMVKPARLKRETPLNWKIDVGVGLADVGATLFDLIGKPLAPSDEHAAAVSLRSALQGPQPDWDGERLIVSESAWTAWRGSEGVDGVSPEIRFALREGPYLFLNDSTSQLFDTFTDNLEVSPVPESDTRSSKVRAEFRAFLKPIAPRAWRSPDRVVIEKLELGRELWRARTPRPETLAELKALSRRFPGDEQLLGWRAIWAIRLGNWAELKAAAKQATDKKVDPSDDQSVSFNRNGRVWAYVAARNLGEKAEPPGDPCFEFVREKAMPAHLVPKSCSADGLMELLSWRDDSASAASRDRAMQEFLRKYLSKTLASRISEANYVVGLAWDVSIPRLNGPDQVDLALALPEFRKLRSTVLRRVANESSASAAETR
jgi:hypothetical protein